MPKKQKKKQRKKKAAQPGQGFDRLHDQGNSELGSGEWAAAELHFRKALRLREDGLGASNAATLDSVHGLAQALEQQGKLDAAMALYERLYGADYNVGN